MQLRCFLPVFVASAGLFAGTLASAATPIKIGIAQPMTGPMTQYGDQVQAGALTAIETINARGGVNGRPLEAVLIDDGCEPKQAVPAANQVINSGAKFAVVHPCSGTAIAAVPIYDNEAIVAITPGATNPLVTDTTNPHFFFRTIGRDDQQGPIAAEYIVNEIKPSSVAILHDKQTYGAGVASYVRDALKERGVNIVMFESINVGDSDYSAIISKLRRINPDLIYFGGYHPEMGLLLRQAREQDLPTRFMAPEGVSNQDLVAIAGPALEGLLVTMPTDFTKVPENKAIVDTFLAANRDPVGVFQMSAYAAVELIAAAIAAVGDDPEEVAEHLHANTFQTAIGEVSFDDKGDLTDFEYQVIEWDQSGNMSLLQ